ncbi:MAG: leucyl aminopeptidase [Pseudomonadales bacterium]|nr:leucyl aminopeptidase [Pseudomonadales bacterium]
MKYSTQTGSLDQLSTPCLVTTLKQARRLAYQSGERTLFDAAVRDFKDLPGRTLLVQLSGASRVARLLIAGGADAALEPGPYRKIVDAAARALRAAGVTKAIWALAGCRVAERDLYWRTAAGLTALSNALYVFSEHKAPADDNGRTLPTGVAVHTDERGKATVQRAVREANALKAGLDFARDLGNQPPNVCNPGYLLREARALGRSAGINVTALSEKQMEALGMGAFMSVTRGSETPGYMIIANYAGGRRNDAPIVLVGKGITFDTGGISLKPGAAMDEMKFDMCGAATVLGTLKAAAAAKLPLNVIAMVAAAENMPSGRATRPGDIVRTLSGKTVEILNTDAEGRLVLCDALTYAERYKPSAVIDVATLTGAMITALGSHASGLFANDDTLAEALLEAGEWSGDRAWRMPLWDEYQEALKSNFADIPNIGTPGAGSITAACFLARFAGAFRWAHMDVAGSAFQGGPAKGATGRPVPLLFRYLCAQAGR